MGDRQRASYLEQQGIRDTRVRAAMASLCRADFVPADQQSMAQVDAPLPIGRGQTISQPYLVAYMSEALQLKGYERVLEIGTGSGYQAAVLALLAAQVFTIELIPALARAARRRLHRLGLRNIFFREGDGHRGWPEQAPFDAIVVTAAPESTPPALLQQIVPGGRLVVPVGGSAEAQTLLRLTRYRETEGFHLERLLPVRFVPMREAPAGSRP